MGGLRPAGEGLLRGYLLAPVCMLAAVKDSPVLDSPVSDRIGFCRKYRVSDFRVQIACVAHQRTDGGCGYRTGCPLTTLLGGQGPTSLLTPPHARNLHPLHINIAIYNNSTTSIGSWSERVPWTLIASSCDLSFCQDGGIVHLATLGRQPTRFGATGSPARHAADPSKLTSKEHCLHSSAAHPARS